VQTEIYSRFKDYDQDHCWQYQIRKENLSYDLRQVGLSYKEAKKLRTSDFDFEYVDKLDKVGCLDIKEFIQRHEWLGKMPNRPTHRFVVRLNTKDSRPIAGVCVMATPNAFSHILGKNNKDLEKLISRGACISWAPKNMASHLIMTSIKWMVKNTSFRAYSAYGDPEAKELGTIYQACNFFYLGQGSGTVRQYYDHDHPERGWFSDREFRKRSKYKMYAERIGIERKQWEEYMGKWSPAWDRIPKHIAEAIKREERKYRNSCEKRNVPAKHKYVLILGQDRRETKKLQKLFDKHNPLVSKSRFHYPKTRGE